MWLRDTAFTLLVLLHAGYREEAVAWRRWLLRAVAGAPDQVQTDTKLNSFVQAYGEKTLDASCLRIALVGFLPATDPRIVGTVEAIERRLMRNGLVLRYYTRQTDDGLPGGEGQFLACSFWMVANLWLIGRKGDARAMFERLLALRNDVELLSEEYDSDAKRMVGNFLQALSHIALVHAAFAISGAWVPHRSEGVHG